MTASVPPLGAAVTATAAVLAPATPPAATDAHVVGALRSAGKLGLSLIGTWAVALVIRIMLPRQLGPELFGAFQFADAFTAGLFVFTGLGIDTYVRKEVAVRREHASEFYGGLTVLRVLAGAVLVVAAVTVLDAAGKPPTVLRLVLVLAVAQIAVVQNATTTAMLHAVGEVDGLSVLNVGAKLLWAVGIAVALLAGTGVHGVAVTMLLAELARLACLEVLVRRHLALRARVNLRAAVTVVAASMPFFALGLSQVLYAKIDVTMLSFLSSDREVGWYGAAAGIAGMAMLLAPLIMWVLLPLSARIGAQAAAEVTALTRRAMTLVLSVAVPVTLLLALGADVVVSLLFGSEFGPATRVLRVLAPVFLLTYVGMVSGTTLMALGRGWLLTAILLSGLALSPGMHWLLVPRFAGLLGPGGAGVGAATALNLTEGYITVVMTAVLGRQVFDGAGLVRLGKMAAICLAVIALDRLLLVSIGPLRLAIDALAYAALAVAWRAVDLRSLLDLARRVSARRPDSHAATP